MLRVGVRMRAAVAVVAVGLLASACSSSSGGSRLDDLDDGPTPNRAERQELRLAVGTDPFLDGGAANLGLLATGPNPGIFDTLTRLSATYSVVPGLAVRWENPSPRQWRIFLRPGVSFHDGRPLDAAAVVANLDTLAARQNRPRGLDPGSARAADRLTVDVALSADNTRLIEQLANPATGIVAPNTRPGNGGDPATTPTGTGPFRFASYTPGAELKVVANDDYWDGAPILRSLTFRFGPEADAGRVLATRQVELVGNVPHSALPTVSGRTDRLVTTLPAKAVYLLLNTGGIGEYDILANDDVRKAVAAAVDREAVAKTAWKEEGTVNAHLVPEIALGKEASERVRPPRRDVEAAKRLLTAAGWAPGPDGVRVKGGRPLVLTLVLARPSEQRPAVAVLRQQLGEVGIGLDVPDLPAGESPFQRLVAATFHLFLDSRFQEDGNPCALCRFFTLEQGGAVNFSASVGGGPVADEIYARVFASPLVDTAKRLAADLMQVVVADRVTAIPLAALRTEWLVSPRVRAFEPSPLPGAQRWDRVWLAR